MCDNQSYNPAASFLDLFPCLKMGVTKPTKPQPVLNIIIIHPLYLDYSGTRDAELLN